MSGFQSILLFTLLSTISINALEQCPQNVQTIDDLDSEKYLGNWYTVFGNINFVTEEGDNCIRASYKSLSK